MTHRSYAIVLDLLFGASLEPGRVAMTRPVGQLQNVVEVGVGTDLTLAQYPATASITGVDVSRDMFVTAPCRDRPEAAAWIKLRAMDAEAMTFARDSFDFVRSPTCPRSHPARTAWWPAYAAFAGRADTS